MHPSIALTFALSLAAAFAPAQDINLALGGTATQTSTSGYGGEHAGLAIDGNRDGFWYNTSTTTTADQPGQSWQVVLTSTGPIHEIVIWNRSDCCAERLANFRCEIKNGATVVFTQDFFTSGGHVPAGRSLRIKVPGSGVTGNTVKLTSLGLNPQGNHYFHVSEVEVIRYGTGRQVNYATYGTATASSNGALAARAIDGNLDGSTPNQSTFTTVAGPGGWLQIDIQRHRIDSIRLWPVTYNNTLAFGCGNLRVAVLDGGVEVFGQNVLPNSLLPINQPTIVTPPSGTTGDAVRITSLGPVQNRELVQLAEVEILQFAGFIGEQWPFGGGCSGSAGVPTLSCAQRPQPGTNLTLHIGGVPAAGIAFLLTGLGNTTWNSQALPLHLLPLGAPGCWALTSLDATTLVLGSGGVANAAFAIPSAGALGVRLFQQAAVLDPTANTLGVTVSNALEQYVGF